MELRLFLTQTGAYYDDEDPCKGFLGYSVMNAEFLKVRILGSRIPDCLDRGLGRMSR